MTHATYEGRLISADSHVIEDPNLWRTRLGNLSELAPLFPRAAGGFHAHPGGHDPNARQEEMAQDGVSAEILYPTLALTLFSLPEADLQAACFRCYNSWLAEYCSVAPETLIGIGVLPAYDINVAVEEARRCADLGMRGLQVWQTPPTNLSFATEHYEALWSAAEEMGLPVSLHILTGFDWSQRVSAGIRGDHVTEGLSADAQVLASGFGYRGMTNYKLLAVTNALHDLIVSGALQRHPRLRIVVVENEIGWIPFVLDQWDKYYARPEFRPPDLLERPSEYFRRQVFATFFNDPPGAHQFDWWGTQNFMWSSDFPHPNSTWPDSRSFVSRDIGHLPADAQRNLAWANCADLYRVPVV